MERYEGKPFLRLLDCYVLKAIGALDSATAQQLRTMEPKLRQIYGMAGTWDGIVAEQMDFDETLPGKIHAIWTRFLSHAEANKFEADPVNFALEFVDRNFPDVVA